MALGRSLLAMLDELDGRSFLRQDL